jgi:hypothetical protein
MEPTEPCLSAKIPHEEVFVTDPQFEEAIGYYLSEGALSVDALLITHYRYGRRFDATKLVETRDYLRQRPDTFENEQGEIVAQSPSNIQDAGNKERSRWHPDDEIKLRRERRLAARKIRRAQTDETGSKHDISPGVATTQATKPQRIQSTETRVPPKNRELTTSERIAAEKIIDHFVKTYNYENKTETVKNLFRRVGAVSDEAEFRKILRKLEARRWVEIINPGKVRGKRKSSVKLYSQEFKDRWKYQRESLLEELAHPIQ